MTKSTVYLLVWLATGTAFLVTESQAWGAAAAVSGVLLSASVRTRRP